MTENNQTVTVVPADGDRAVQSFDRFADQIRVEIEKVSGDDINGLAKIFNKTMRTMLKEKGKMDIEAVRALREMMGDRFKVDRQLYYKVRKAAAENFFEDVQANITVNRQARKDDMKLAVWEHYNKSLNKLEMQVETVKSSERQYRSLIAMMDSLEKDFMEFAHSTISFMEIDWSKQDKTYKV